MKDAKRPLWFQCIAIFVAVGVTASLSLAVFAAPAAAQQQQQQRRTLLEFLFGKRQQRPVDVYPQRPARAVPRAQQTKPKKRTAPAQTTAGAAAAAVEKPAPVIEKLDNAKKVLVVGDFFAAGIGDGLNAAFETSPGVKIVARTDVASGLVRSDHYDWQRQLPKFIDEVKPAVVVVMIGSNDRQQMTVGGQKEKFRTEAWFEEYGNRTLALAKQVADRKVPLLWVGLPAFQSPAMTADAVQLNGLFRTQVEKAGGEFIDIWDGFVDENGKFVITGADINGQQVRLRGGDGINMTKAGKRKLAFYVEKSARRLLGDMASPDLLKLDSDNLPHLVNLPPGPAQNITRTLPINLSDPELDGGSILLGATPAPTLAIKTARDRLIDDGETTPAPAGRIDDYALPADPSASRE